MKRFLGNSILFLCILSCHRIQTMSDIAVDTQKGVKGMWNNISLYTMVMHENKLTQFLAVTDINQQDDCGNTPAHAFASIGIKNRPILMKIFNTFITKGINPSIKNKKGKTAYDIAVKCFCKSPFPVDALYQTNLNLFQRLENYSSNSRFVLENPSDDILFKY